jgi:hypothetical protein
MLPAVTGQGCTYTHLVRGKAAVDVTPHIALVAVNFDELSLLGWHD